MSFAMTNNKIKYSSTILLGTIMLTAVFAFSNIPPAQAVTETITFDGNLDFDTNYLEDGMLVTSGQQHIHGNNNLRNHSGCCSTPYTFVYNGGDNFTPVSVQASSLCGTNTLTAQPSGNTINLAAGNFVFPQNADWTNITSFSWHTNCGGIMDDLVFNTAIPVDVDFKPGSDPSSVNCAKDVGVVPVLIFGASFDLVDIDLSTLTVNGVTVTEAHDKNHVQPGDQETVLHLEAAGVCDATSDATDYPLRESATITLEGSTTGGDDFEGTADIRIVKR